MESTRASLRGADREAGLDRERYFSDGYFELSQLCSFAHQIHRICALRPRRVLEVGMGNGFVSTFLRNAGISVTTVDINPNLGPDICCDLETLPAVLDEKFDLVSCCEVLEHMPWSQFERNVQILRYFADTLFLTLPYGRKRIGAGGIVSIPRFFDLRPAAFHVDVPFHRKAIAESHYWEANHSRSSSMKKILAVLGQSFKHVQTGVFELNACHQYFICQSLSSAGDR